MKPPLPMRHGVNPSSCWLPEGQWKTILAFLCDNFPAISESLWRQRIQANEIVDNNNKIITEHTAYYSGIHLFYYRELPPEIHIPFNEQILFQDEHLLVVDKPHFLPVIPTGRFLQESLLVRLKNTLGNKDLTPIHRIDKDTAGLVMFSCRRDSRKHYHQLFENNAVHKTYHAIAASAPHLTFPIVRKNRLADAEEFFRTAEVDGIENSESHIHLLENRGATSLYRLEPITGKKHQLRVHMNALGLPLLNDVLYPTIRTVAADDFSQPLQLLAKTLHFIDPVSLKSHRFTSPRDL